MTKNRTRPKHDHVNRMCERANGIPESGCAKMRKTRLVSSWCPRRDSNSHALRRRILNQVELRQRKALLNFAHLDETETNRKSVSGHAITSTDGPLRLPPPQTN